ncbi:unnamed protein product [Prunus armeniaca]
MEALQQSLATTLAMLKFLRNITIWKKATSRLRETTSWFEAETPSKPKVAVAKLTTKLGPVNQFVLRCSFKAPFECLDVSLDDKVFKLYI